MFQVTCVRCCLFPALSSARHGTPKAAACRSLPHFSRWPPLCPCSSPAVASATPDGPTNGTVVITPPANTTSPVDRYELTLVPEDGSPTVLVNCTTPASCPVTGLLSCTNYTVTVVAVLQSGATLAGSNSATLSTPCPGAPTLDSAVGTGPTTGTAQASPGSGGPFSSYNFTAVEAGTGTVFTCVSSTSSCDFTGLAPGTAYEVSVVATDGSGKQTPASNTKTMTTFSPT